MTDLLQTSSVGSDAMLDRLRQRRSVTVYTPEVPSRKLIERVVEAATWGPDHKRTQPWRFVVLTGKAREEFGDFLASIVRSEVPDLEDEACRRQIEKERSKPLRAPVLVVAAAVPQNNPAVPHIEEIKAVAAGMQNMLLAADALGLGGIWRTGWPAYRDEVKEYLGLPSDAHIAGFVYLGFPAVPHLSREREDANAFIAWRDAPNP